MAHPIGCMTGQILLASALIVLVEPMALGQNAAQSALPVWRVVNVTSDSAPGWLPTIEQSRMAEATLGEFLGAADSGNAEGTYQHFSDLNKRDMSLDAFKTDLMRFNARAGSVVERRIVKVTWTKDSPNAPIPGAYAAIDLASRFVNIDRHCGYVVLYQPSKGGDFQVMREEANFIDNVSAERMKQEHSAAYLDSIWAQLSANCPNYQGHSAKPN